MRVKYNAEFLPENIHGKICPPTKPKPRQTPVKRKRGKDGRKEGEKDIDIWTKQE